MTPARRSPTPRDTPPSARPGWTLHRCDWLAGARDLAPASVDLVYADPPFNTGKTQRGSAGAYPDTWATPDEWCEWFSARLSATIPALKPTGAVLIHCDWRTAHRVRISLDDLLGPACFVNHLIWAYGLGGSSRRRFARKHDDILFYAREPNGHYFEPHMVPATSNRMKGELKKATDVLDIPAINNMANERTGYPTQKPLALLELLVSACCPPGGTVLDPCMGSGTTLVAAAMHGRRAIGFDVSEDAVRVARGRLEAREVSG